MRTRVSAFFIMNFVRCHVVCVSVAYSCLLLDSLPWCECTAICSFMCPRMKTCFPAIMDKTAMHIEAQVFLVDMCFYFS